MPSPAKFRDMLVNLANSIDEDETIEEDSDDPVPVISPYNFLTGSHAYGKPKRTSDIDLVVMVNAETEALLQKLSDNPASIRFGKLSLICCHSELEMSVWRVGTEQMKTSGKKFHKMQAKSVLDKIRNLVNLEDRTASGS